jgi:hypothetical protein
MRDDDNLRRRKMGQEEELNQRTWHSCHVRYVLIGLVVFFN